MNPEQRADLDIIWAQNWWGSTTNSRSMQASTTEATTRTRCRPTLSLYSSAQTTLFPATFSCGRCRAWSPTPPMLKAQRMKLG